MSKAPPDSTENSAARTIRRAISALTGTGAGAGTLIDARQLRIGLVRAHGPVDAMHLVHHRGDRRLAGGALSHHSSTTIAVPMIDSSRLSHPPGRCRGPEPP